MLYIVAVILLATLLLTIFTIGRKSTKRDTTIVLEQVNQHSDSAHNH